jgi:protein O-mannosyl-transferase
MSALGLEQVMSRSGPKSTARWISVALALITVAVYWPVVTCDFVRIDDWVYVSENADVNAGLSWRGVAWAFRSRLAGNWHPLTTLSHMLDCQVYGLRAGGHHFTNLLFHAANTVLLFVVLRRMTGATWRSALVAALFALHPLRVESVAWVSERKDVLSGFFFLLTLWAYARYVEVQSLESRVLSLESKVEAAPDTFHLSRFYALSLVFFALGLMSKPMLVTVPFVLLLLDYWPLQRLGEARIREAESRFTRHAPRSTLLALVLEKLPFFALATAASVVAFLTQKGGGAVLNLHTFPLPARLSNAIISYARYLGKTLWPDSLAVFYQYPGGWAAWKVLGATALFAGLSLAAIGLARRRPYVFVGWFWFAGMLVPVIGLVQVGCQALADRYTYLPQIGLLVIVSWGLTELLASRASRRLMVSGAAALLLASAVTTSLQLRHWKNSQALFDHALRVTEHNAPAHYCLGYILETQGKTNEAFVQYTQALSDASDFVEAHRGLAGLLASQGRLPEAAAEYRLALDRRPGFAQAHYGLADVLVKQGQVDDAINHYAAALGALPAYAEAHYQLAVLLSARQEIPQAVLHYREAVRLKPHWLEALNNLAWLLATQPDAKFRNGSEAVLLAAHAVELTKTNNPGALDTLGAALAEAGRFNDAVNAARKAAELAAAAGQNELAASFEERRQAYEARRPFREAARSATP